MPLTKEEAAPGKSIRGEVAWVAAAEVEATGDCHAVPIMQATGIIPILGSPPAGEGDGGAGVTILVPGSAVSWLDTGISVRAGQTFTISASGVIAGWDRCSIECPAYNMANCSSLCSHTVNGPAGGWAIVSQVVSDASQFPMPNEMLWALIGRVGGGRAFLVGEGGTFTAGSDGAIQFIVNDLSIHELDINRGSFIVIIEVQGGG